MLPIVLIGSPGSGKGTQGKLLSQYYGIPHISTGELLRSHVQRGDALGRTVKEIVDKGGLVPDSLMQELVQQRLTEQDCTNGYILDGFPRTLQQAQWFYIHYAQPMVFLLEVEHDEVIRRILLRNEGRPDDRNPEVIEKRLREYEERTAPLIGYYEREAKFYRVGGRRGVQDILSWITRVLEMHRNV